MTVIGQNILFIEVVGLLLGDHALTGATSLSWPTETNSAVVIGHLDCLLQA